MFEYEKMKWLAENLRLYEFLTPRALELKHDIQKWTESSSWDGEMAAQLERRFTGLSQAGPVEVCAGLYRAGASGRGDREIIKTVGRAPACGEILPGTRTAFYVHSQGCFVGEADVRSQAGVAFWDAALDESAARAEHFLSAADARFEQALKTCKAEGYAAIYDKRNFGLVKAALAVLTVTAILLTAPAWWAMAREMAVLVFSGNFGQVPVFLREVEETLSFFVKPPFQAAAVAGLLLSVPLGLLLWKQLVWEIYFALYRTAARITLWYSAKRFRGRMKKLKGRIASIRRGLRNVVQITPGKQMELKKLLWAPPKWVRIGDNPRFSLKKPGQFFQNFTVYPEKGPKNKKRSWGFLPFLFLFAYAMMLLRLHDWTGGLLPKFFHQLLSG